jgi:hypothetical protein
MFTLCIRLIGVMVLFFWTALPQSAAADCLPNALGGQGSTGSCDVGSKPLSSNQTGTSSAPCGTNAPPLSGVYEPSTGTGNGGVYEPSTGTGNGSVYSTTPNLAPSGSLGGAGTLGCPNGGSVGALRSLPIDSSGRVLGSSNRSVDPAQTPTNKRTSNNRESNNSPINNSPSNNRASNNNPRNNSAHFHGVKASRAHT